MEMPLSLQLATAYLTARCQSSSTKIFMCLVRDTFYRTYPTNCSSWPKPKLGIWMSHSMSINKPWIQLFSVHSFIRSSTHIKQVPLASCFMSRKRSEDYYEVKWKYIWSSCTFLHELYTYILLILMYMLSGPEGNWPSSPTSYCPTDMCCGFRGRHLEGHSGSLSW